VTRINCIPPRELTREHLVAEYRELPRVFGLVRAAAKRGETPASIRKRAPGEYTLGRGHLMFFYTRLLWLVNRYDQIVSEMQRRGYTVNFPDANRDGIPLAWFGTWSPLPRHRAINRKRINQRLAEAKQRRAT
jgi:deoxyribonuclease (pyrimidine dimer)